MEDAEIMPEAVDQILAQLQGLENRLEGRLDRVESKVDAMAQLSERVAVLERQDQVDRDNGGRVHARLDALEAERRALARVDHLRERVAELQEAMTTRASAETVARLATTLDELSAAVSAKASTTTMTAEATRITALETDRAKREGVSRGVLLVWTAVTALPGLVGMGLGLWAAYGG